MKFCYPKCDKFTEGMKKVNGPIELQSLRSGGQYEFDQEFIFQYCPWCGNKLIDVQPIANEVNNDSSSEGA